MAVLEIDEGVYVFILASFNGITDKEWSVTIILKIMEQQWWLEEKMK